MLSYQIFAPITAVLATATASSITFQNVGGTDLCYMVELSSGTFPSTTPCGLGQGISVNAGETVAIGVDPSFNGALNAFTNGIRGARYEVNFAATAGSTWYDTDYQYGMSDGTCGPTDLQPRANGQNSLSGEPDTLAKANAAWPTTTNKAALLAYPQYLKQGSDGTLTSVYSDSNSPQVVIEFFQVTAEFTAYIDAGSVAGVTPSAADAEAVAKANANSYQVATQDMSIIAH